MEFSKAIGTRFDGRVLLQGDERDRRAYENGGGWIVYSNIRLYVRFDGNGTVEEAYTWIVAGRD